MPPQEFSNAFSLFLAQNYGSKKFDRIRKGVREAYAISIAFCVLVSVLVWVFAEPLIAVFLDQPDPQIIAAGIRYLHIEGAFYCGISCLFLFYGLYRALNRPLMSFVLTVISLGTRVVLAYALAPVPKFGVSAVWWAIPIGWGLADLVGLVYYRRVMAKNTEIT